jgi:hypothetical protein
MWKQIKFEGEIIMGITYDRDYIEKILNDTKKKADKLYKMGIVNYTGKTSDTSEFYTEVIAQYILDQHDYFEGILENTRQSSYKVPEHNKKMDIPTSNRKEEILAITMFTKLNHVLDYQVPLKNIQTDDDGKVDLLIEQDNALFLTELKGRNSRETLLRAVLEIETYYRTVDKAKLLRDYNKEDKEVRKALLIFENSEQYRDLTDKDKPKPKIRELVKKLDISVWVFNELAYEEKQF